MPGEHARRSPSGAEKWWNCAGSIQLEAFFPEEETSEYAAEGTCAHTIRERCLNNGTDVSAYVGEWMESEGFKFQVEDDWAHALQPGIDWIRDQDMEWVFEYRVKLDTWMPGDFGTLDAGGWNDKLIVINDLKFGRGMLVDVEWNKQLMIYALGFWENHARHHTDATTFLLMIDQPRAQGGGISEFTIELDDLLRFGEELAIRAARTEDPDAGFMVTPKGCHWCKGLSNFACRTMHDFMIEMMTGFGIDAYGLGSDIDEEIELIIPDTLTPEQRSHILRHKALINKWVKAAHDLHLSDAIAGEPTPGFKAVDTEGNREWEDPEAAEKFMLEKLPKHKVFNQQLKSPAQAEKILGTRNWRKAQDLIVRKPGAPALVPESDKRPALIPVTELFDDESGDDDLQSMIESAI